MPLILSPCRRDALPHACREHRPPRFVFSGRPVREDCWARVTEWNDIHLRIAVVVELPPQHPGFSSGSDGDGDGGNIWKRNTSVLSLQPASALPPEFKAGVVYRNGTKELRLPIASTVRYTQQPWPLSVAAAAATPISGHVSSCCCDQASPFYPAGWEKQIQICFLPRRGKRVLWGATAGCNRPAYRKKNRVPGDPPPETLGDSINSVSHVTAVSHSLKRDTTVLCETWADKDTYLVVRILHRRYGVVGGNRSVTLLGVSILSVSRIKAFTSYARSMRKRSGCDTQVQSK